MAGIISCPDRRTAFPENARPSEPESDALFTKLRSQMWMQKYKKISRFLTFKRFLYQTEEYFYYFYICFAYYPFNIILRTLNGYTYTFCYFFHKTEASINIISIFAEQINRSFRNYELPDNTRRIQTFIGPKTD